MSMMAGPPAGGEPWPCSGTDLVLWYGPPEPDEDPAGYFEPPDQRRWRERRAKQLCEACPVRPSCLEEELALPPWHQWGVRGGMTETERRVLLRERRRAERERAS